jgi:peptide/nickel transport system permease protein
VARFLVRRLALLLLTLWLMSVLVFVIALVVPGDVAQTILGKSATPQQVAALRRQLDLDHPPPVLYLRWIGGFVTGDWGDSPSLQAPINSVLPNRFVNLAVWRWPP